MVTFFFYTMHLCVDFNKFNREHWIAVLCEASGASKAPPAVAEASDSSGSYLLLYITNELSMKALSTSVMTS